MYSSDPITHRYIRKSDKGLVTFLQQHFSNFSPPNVYFDFGAGVHEEEYWKEDFELQSTLLQNDSRVGSYIFCDIVENDMDIRQFQHTGFQF